MSIKNRLQDGFDQIMKVAGRSITIDYYRVTNDDIGSVWDDDITLVKSGTTLNTSGIVMPLNKASSSESLLKEQGKLIDGDKRLYLNSGVTLTGSEFFISIGVGGESYTTIPEGGITPEVGGGIVYKKTFIRRFTGSPILGLDPGSDGAGS